MFDFLDQMPQPHRGHMPVGLTKEILALVDQHVSNRQRHDLKASGMCDLTFEGAFAEFLILAFRLFSRSRSWG